MEMKQVAMPQKEYIVQLSWEVDGETKVAYRLAGKRMSLDSIVYAWRRGEGPEGIRDSFPSLSLEEIYGALAFYLANREEIDEYLRQGEVEFEKMRKQCWEDIRRDKPELYERLTAHREERLKAA